MVLDNKFGVEHLKQPREGVRRGSVNAQATVASQFGEHNILVAQEPLVETHREAHQFHGPIGQQRNTRDIEEFLFGIGVEGQQWVRVLGEVMGSVVFPETADIVHQTVVPIEPEVQDNSVQSGLKWQPVPAHIGRCLAGSIA